MNSDASGGEGLATHAGALSVVVFSGDFERVHYALVLASAAAALGGPATLFFTGEAIRALVANDGWRMLPAAGGATGGEIDTGYVSRGVAGFAELLEACVAMGVRFIVCEMGLRVIGLTRTALRDDVPIEEAGVVTLLAASFHRAPMLI
jgi:Uncharacterized conserved protein